MNKYVVAYCNLIEGTITQEVVEANSALEAGKSYLNWFDMRGITTLLELYDLVADCDGFLHVLSLKSYPQKYDRSDWGSTHSGLSLQ